MLHGSWRRSADTRRELSEITPTESKSPLQAGKDKKGIAGSSHVTGVSGAAGLLAQLYAKSLRNTDDISQSQGHQEASDRDTSEEKSAARGKHDFMTWEEADAYKLIERFTNHKDLYGFYQNRDKRNSRAELHKELMDMSQNRRETLIELVKANPTDVKEIFGHDSQFMESSINTTINVIKCYSELSLNRLKYSTERRNSYFNYAVAHEYTLEKYQRDLTNPERTKGGSGRLPETILAQAYERLRDTGGTDYWALSAIEYEVQRSYGQFHSSVRHGELAARDGLQETDDFKAIKKTYEDLVTTFRDSDYKLQQKIREEIDYTQKSLSQATEQCIQSLQAMLKLETQAKEKYLGRQVISDAPEDL